MCRAQHRVVEIVGQHMTVQFLGDPKHQSEKLPPVRVVVAPFAVTRATVGVFRAGVGLRGMRLEGAGPAGVARRRILVAQHFAQGPLGTCHAGMFQVEKSAECGLAHEVQAIQPHHAPFVVPHLLVHLGECSVEGRHAA